MNRDFSKLRGKIREVYGTGGETKYAELLGLSTSSISGKLNGKIPFSLPEMEAPQFIGPVRAPIYKVNDIYRKILYIKSEKCDILDRIRDLTETLAAGDERFRSVMIQYDIS